MRRMSSWEKYVKKYVWDDERTPYLVSVDKLKRRQADKEIFIFVVFLAIPFTLILLAAIAQMVKAGNYEYVFVALFAISILAAVVVLHATKSWPAALYCITAPLAILLYFVVNGFSAKQGMIDQIIILVVLLSWLRYTVRVIQIARAYPDLPDPPPPSDIPELPTFTPPD
ncbi:MAG: hypothetical protein QF654_02760 [Alphaproteobacteria bacterium]|nr:hypothetical protein [Alphaproteobacteria bacterium]